MGYKRYVGATCRKKVRSKAHKTGNQNDWIAAKQLRNQANNLAKHLKKRYYEDAISDNVSNTRKIWSLAKEASSIRNSVTLPISTSSNKQKIADDFNGTISA